MRLAENGSHGRAGRANDSLLIRDVKVLATACIDRVDQGLQQRRRGRFGPCRPPALRRDPGRSQARTAQRPRPGRRPVWRGVAPLSAAVLWPRCRSIVLRRIFAEPGIPAEAECAACQGLVPADGGVGAYLAEVAQPRWSSLIAPDRGGSTRMPSRGSATLRNRSRSRMHWSEGYPEFAPTGT